jgi:hypothetical protein
MASVRDRDEVSGDCEGSSSESERKEDIPRPVAIHFLYLSLSVGKHVHVGLRQCDP